jgi:EAL domain-containing protein (putative c-di-GMP-specific phosphodiesterase class I)
MKNRRKLQRADLPPGADSPLDAAMEKRSQSTMDSVRLAVTHGQTMLAYQPVMQARAPHGVAFYEGLVRVLDATGRVIPARDFMPMVENTELAREIDCAALEHGLKTLFRNPDVRLSINMSARSISYKRWLKTLERHLKKSPTLGERLILEINEDSAMNMPEIVIDFMDQLQEHGISFALDDFGAGQTRFRQFRDFFFDAVKIDGQFVRNVDSNIDNQAAVRALVAVARSFDMLTVAVAVETEAEARFLVELGVDCLQGYLFGAPTVRPPWIPDRRAGTPQTATQPA